MKRFHEAQLRLIVPLTALLSVPGLQADTGEFLIIQDKLESQRIQLVELDDDILVHLKDGLWVTVDLDRCIALFDTTSKSSRLRTGQLVLADGQRFPGEPMHDVTDYDKDMLSWSHRWLGRIDVPLEDIDTVVFQSGTIPPDDGEMDSLLLSNGDRLDGFIVSLHDPVVIEVNGERTELIEVPRSNVAALNMISTTKPHTSRRVWFDDGTVLDVNSIRIGDDSYIRLTSKWHSAGTKPAVVKLSLLDSILLDPDRLLPLAVLKPNRIEGPKTRYLLPAPKVLDPDASLKLSPIEFQGPIISRYVLPPGCRRFACEAVLPPGSRSWGDFELILHNNDQEVFRTRLNAENPSVKINVALEGPELTIELTEGANGSIQDRVILNFPMLLIEGD